MLDMLFRNARIVDGSGQPAYTADLAVEGDHIAAIGHLEGAPVATVIDAGGRVLCPGFIDVHVHSELEMLAGRHTAGVQMGVTTEFLCPDGMSFGPLSGQRLAGYRRYLYAIYGGAEAGWDWQSFADYLGHFPGRIRNNVVAQAPHGAIRLAACGWAPGPAGVEELAAMRQLTRECMEAGAAGLNTGLEYLPAAHAGRQELIELCAVVAEYGGVFATHLRSYAPGTVGVAIDEAASVAAAAGVPLHISHFTGAPEVYAVAEAAHARGVDVTWDAYPYCAGCTMLAYALPPEHVDGGPGQLIEDLRQPSFRRAVRAALERRFPPDSPAYFAGLSRPHNQWMEGRRLREVWEGSGKAFEDFICDLLIDEELRPLLILPWPDPPEANQGRLRHTLTHPLHMVATDGIYVGRFAHPRAWGTYPRLLRRYVREERWLGLEDAIRKATGFPAARFGLRDRGLLRPGMAADLVVFDPEAVADRATYESPRQPPLGIEHVLVNGVPVVREGVLTEARPGRLLQPRL